MDSTFGTTGFGSHAFDFIVNVNSSNSNNSISHTNNTNPIPFTMITNLGAPALLQKPISHPLRSHPINIANQTQMAPPTTLLGNLLSFPAPPPTTPARLPTILEATSPSRPTTPTSVLSALSPNSKYNQPVWTPSSPVASTSLASIDLAALTFSERHLDLSLRLPPSSPRSPSVVSTVGTATEMRSVEEAQSMGATAPSSLGKRMRNVVFCGEEEDSSDEEEEEERVVKKKRFSLGAVSASGRRWAASVGRSGKRQSTGAAGTWPAGMEKKRRGIPLQGAYHANGPYPLSYPYVQGKDPLPSIAVDPFSVVEMALPNSGSQKEANVGASAHAGLRTSKRKRAQEVTADEGDEIATIATKRSKSRQMH
ncbi:hypothetical protein BT63DRAFT_478732 [Microthyrium microscopicum]|uniref:Uncharacterized protein n=1 Tax=Microthyrium microscopicum TaxID=703497 RepID=A0A6A6UHP3_9PEZI|nr:hypothetical protein BT63DRAFT_478732 [Microthyrium microscopicum]